MSVKGKQGGAIVKDMVSASNNSLYYPFTLLAYNVEQRHIFLWNTIGYKEEEAESIATIRRLLYGSLCYLVFGSMLEAFFFNLYNERFHPFKDIMDTGGKGHEFNSILNNYILVT